MLRQKIADNLEEKCLGQDQDHKHECLGYDSGQECPGYMWDMNPGQEVSVNHWIRITGRLKRQVWFVWL